MRNAIPDGINILSRITAGRLYNAFRIYGSYYLSRIRGKPLHAGLPFTISIEPTTTCNLQCPECPSGLRKFTRPTGQMSLELYTDIIDQLSPELFYLILYFQGEPFMNPLFFKFVEYAGSKDIYTATSTNAHFLNDALARKTIESGLDRIIISLDGIGQETYESYRVGGSYEKVISGIRNLLRWREELKSSTPHIVLQFIVFSSNEHQVEDVKKLARELNVDRLELKSAQVYDFEQGNPRIPSDKRWSRYVRGSKGKYVIDNKLYNHCLRMWRGCVITWDGLVVPCCFDKDADHRLGDLKEHSFKEIWEGERYRLFREKVFTSRKEIDICRNCTEK